MACSVLLIAASSGAQEQSALPETARPVRRLDAAIPVTLNNPATPEAISMAGTSKTPIRRVADAAGADSVRPRSSWAVWVMLAGLVGGATGISLWTRRSGGASHWKLPSTVFQVLGKSPVGPNQSVTLLRLGDRVLLVSSSGATMQTLAVVTDPVEVSTITAECLSRRSAQIIGPNGGPRARPSDVTGNAAVAGTVGNAPGSRRPARPKSEASHA